MRNIAITLVVFLVLASCSSKPHHDLIGKSYQGQLGFKELNQFEFLGSSFFKANADQQFDLKLLADRDTALIVFEKIETGSGNLPQYTILDIKDLTYKEAEEHFCMAGCNCKAGADTINGIAVLAKNNTPNLEIIAAWKGNTDTRKVDTVPINKITCTQNFNTEY